MIKKIAFVGDSFCCSLESPRDDLGNPVNSCTYIQLLQDYYNAEIVHLGVGGSSIWDAVLNQLTTVFKINSIFEEIKEENIPDVLVFSWSEINRLYHKTVRNLNIGSVVYQSHHGDQYNLDAKLLESAKGFYTHLYDRDYQELTAVAFLYFIDNVVLQKIADKCKIIHMWSFSNTPCGQLEDNLPSKLKYIYRWTNGVELRPALISLSILDNFTNILVKDKRANHLEDYKQEILFSWIRLIIDKYENGKLFDFTSQVEFKWQEYLKSINYYIK